MISFGDFRFNPNQQVLYRGDKPIDLTHKQAKLLALLLESPDTIFSKEEILDLVWEGRAVSEQVVFQNISKLRTLIAQDAIKTYPKRGYQWQIPLEVSLQGAASQTNQKSGIAHYLVGSVLGIAVLLVLALAFLPSAQQEAKQQQTPNPIIFLPVKARFEGALEKDLRTLNEHIAQKLSTGVVNGQAPSSQRFMNSPFMERQRLGLSADTIVGTGVLRGIKDQFLLTLKLQGEYRGWESIIAARDIETVAQTATDHIELITGSQYFSLQDDAHVTAELTLLHDLAPQNPAILTHLIDRQIVEMNTDVAGAYIDKLLALSRMRELPVYEAMALWLGGKRALALADLGNARQYLEDAIFIAGDAEILFMQSEILKSQADLAYRHGDFDTVRQLLTDAASRSRLSNELVKEVRAYTLLSIMASKFGLEKEKYEYLHHAKALLADGNFDDSHYMIINYHFALFAPGKAEQERWYREALARPVTPENSWVFESAADQLVDLLVDDKRWENAFEVADRVSAAFFAATAHKLRATTLLAQGDVDQALIEAKEAFTLARIRGHRWVALPMALLLLENGTGSATLAESAEYKRYLQDKTTGRWKDWQKERLATLGISRPQ